MDGPVGPAGWRIGRSAPPGRGADSTCREDPVARVTRDVLFREGQIVHHVRYGYRGVIAACDRTCKADDSWYEFQIRGKGYRPTREQPWYHVLVDGSARQTYVAQQNLEAGDSTRPIDHPLIHHFFNAFHGGTYHRPSWN